MVPAEKDNQQKTSEETHTYKWHQRKKDAARIACVPGKKKVRMFEWITVCAHAYFSSLGESMRVCARSLYFCRRRSLGHTDTLGTSSSPFVASSVGVPSPAVHSLSVEVGGVRGWGCTRGEGKRSECSGQFVIFFPFELSATEKGHCTLMSEEKKNVVARVSVSVFGLVCLLVLFSLEGALAAAVRTLCRRPSRKGAPPR